MLSRFPRRADAARSCDRTVPHQGADHDRLAARRLCLHRALLRGALRCSSASLHGRFRHRSCSLRCSFRSSCSSSGVLHLLNQRLAMHRDVPTLRRYLGVLIETSMPTFVLYAAHELHGTGAGAGLRRAAVLFHLHHSLDACGSISGFRPSPASSPRRSCSRWRCCIIRRVLPRSRPPSSASISIRSLMFLLAGILAGAVGVQLRRQFEASIARRHRARPRHQSVRPARFAAGGRAADARGRRRPRAISAVSP